jgi:putative hydrolase of the HAD superfamily
MIEVIKKPDIVLIDIDNTIYPYNSSHQAAISVAEKKFRQLFPSSELNFRLEYEKAKLRVKLKLKNTASSHNRLLYFQNIFESNGMGSQFLLSYDLYHTYWNNFLANSELFDYFINFLEALRRLDIKICLVTDLLSEIQFKKVLFHNLDSYIDFIVSSEEVGFDKPKKNIFVSARNKINKNAKVIWMIGDDVEKDMIVAKKSLNAITFLKCKKNFPLKSNSKFVNYQFENYKDLIEFLNKIND